MKYSTHAKLAAMNWWLDQLERPIKLMPDVLRSILLLLLIYQHLPLGK